MAGSTTALQELVIKRMTGANPTITSMIISPAFTIDILHGVFLK